MTLFLRYRYGVRISEHNFWRDAELPTIIERHFAGILYVEFDGDRYLGYYLRTELLSINFIFSFFFLNVVSEIKIIFRRYPPVKNKTLVRATRKRIRFYFKSIRDNFHLAKIDNVLLILNSCHGFAV